MKLIYAFINALIVSLHVRYLFRSIARRKTFASSSAEATRTRTLPVDPVGSRTALRRWKIRYATSRCRISTRARVAGRHSRRARPRNYLRSHLPIIKLRTRLIARTMKLVRTIRTTVLSVTLFVIAGKWFNLTCESLSLDNDINCRIGCRIVVKLSTTIFCLLDFKWKHNFSVFVIDFQFSSYQAIVGIWWWWCEQRVILGRTNTKVIGFQQIEPWCDSQRLRRLLWALYSSERTSAQDTGIKSLTRYIYPKHKTVWP